MDMNHVRALAALAAVTTFSFGHGHADELRADAPSSSLKVKVGKAGALSVFGHDHEFSPERWRADARFDPARPEQLRVELVVDAASLHDHEPGLSRKDRAKVDSQTAGPEVLDARRFPEIRYRGTARDVHAAQDGSLSGVLRGMLELHGASRPLDVPFNARSRQGAYVATGAASFRQSEFGIRPFRTAMGTVRVRDEVKVEFELAFPSAAADSAAAPVRGARSVAESGNRSR